MPARRGRTSASTTTKQIGRVIVDPHDPDDCLRGRARHTSTARTPIAASTARTTAARRGRRSSSRTTTVGAIDLAFDPANPQIVYAALWATRRPPWFIYAPANGPGSGLFKSTDGGTTWTAADGGPAGRRARPHRHRDRAGQSEARLRDRRREGGRAVPLGRRGRDVREDLRRHAHLGPRLVLREGHGGSEERRRGLRDEHRRLQVDGRGQDAGRRSRARRAATTITAVDRARRPEPDDRRQRPGRDRVARRRRRRGAPGTTSRPRSSITWPPTTAFPYWVTGAQQDSGAVGTPARSPRGVDLHPRLGAALRRRRERLHRARSAASGDPLRRHRREVQRRSPARRRTCRRSVASQGRSATPGRSRSCSRQADPHALYFANQFVYKTTDGGESWAQISHDLTREDPGRAAEPRRGGRRRRAGRQAPRRRLHDRAVAAARAARLGRHRRRLIHVTRRRRQDLAERDAAGADAVEQGRR